MPKRAGLQRRSASCLKLADAAAFGQAGSALEESKQGEVHLVDFALFTDASGVAAEIAYAHLPSWQAAADSGGHGSWDVGGPAPSAAHDASLLKRTVFVKGATRTQLRHFTALRTTLAVCGNVAQVLVTM